MKTQELTPTPQVNPDSLTPDAGPRIVYGVFGTYIKFDPVTLTLLSGALNLAAHATDRYGLSRDMNARKQASEFRVWSMLFEAVCTAMVNGNNLIPNPFSRDGNPEAQVKKAAAELLNLESLLEVNFEFPIFTEAE